MPADTNIVDLRRMLAERFPEAHQPRRLAPGEAWASGVPALDELLGGGFSKGALTELVGDGPGSGSAQVIHALLVRTATDGRFLALIDGADSFDVDAAEPKALSRLLWVRCRTAAEALKAADLVLRDRNLPLVVLDLKLNPLTQLRQVPSSVWHRYARIAEHNGTSVLVVTPFPLVGAVTTRVEIRSGLGIEALTASPTAVLHRLQFELLRSAAGEEVTAGRG